jgi:hypothetical protein
LRQDDTGDRPVNDESAAHEIRHDERAAEGIGHLQAAAHEMIAAARAFLDVIEDFVGDEQKLSSVAEAVTSVARGAARSVRTDSEPPPDEPESGSVQHIRVS